MTSASGSSLRVAIGGFGAIGVPLARRLDEGLEGLTLAAVSGRDHDKARGILQGFKYPVPVLTLGELANLAEVVVECAPAAVFDEVAVPAIERGRIFMPASVGAMLPRMHLVDRARKTGARILIPTGALVGLDAVRAAAQGKIADIRIVSRKPPRGWAGAPHIVDNDISLEGLTEPKKIFYGSAREAAKGFPANVNVAAALSLAGIGPDETMIELWADPGVDRNIHRIICDADSASFEMRIENIPSEDNPRTGKITPLSMLACLEGLVSPLKVGT